MGGCAAVPQAPAGQAESNKDINRKISSDARKAEKEIKLLLLGAGESGKTTISKQIRILHKQPFSEEERNSYKSIIYSNTISSMRVLLEAASDLGIPLDSENLPTADSFLRLQDTFANTISPETVGFLKTLWKDRGVQETLTHAAEFHLNDSASYFFNDLTRIAAPDYIPSEEDVIRSRARTTGIIETEFDSGGSHFRLVDVGGQRSERKKWIHCFQDVTAVIYCVALSEYDLKLFEDDTTNRMLESLRLFKEVCNNKWFLNTAIVLFLNKKDVFEEKIKRIDLSVCFPEYTGVKEFEPAVQFIQEQFLKQNENPSKHIYCHVTCAMDKSNIEFVFRTVQDTLVSALIDESGMI